MGAIKEFLVLWALFMVGYFCHFDSKMRAEGKEKTVLGIFVEHLVENGQWIWSC